MIPEVEMSDREVLIRIELYALDLIGRDVQDFLKRKSLYFGPWKRTGRGVVGPSHPGCSRPPEALG